MYNQQKKPSQASIFYIVSTHVEPWRSHLRSLSTNDIKRIIFGVQLYFYL